eukprot:GEMP01070598.1.p1 GENE.GEMP01070598.1~~GEMP01070598.1.p1  ORF type:complete len:134 (+),score=17.00 GEMP01070598.1:278-679(+)
MENGSSSNKSKAQKEENGQEGDSVLYPGTSIGSGGRHSGDGCRTLKIFSDASIEGAYSDEESGSQSPSSLPESGDGKIGSLELVKYMLQPERLEQDGENRDEPEEQEEPDDIWSKLFNFLCCQCTNLRTTTSS